MTQDKVPMPADGQDNTKHPAGGDRDTSGGSPIATEGGLAPTAPGSEPRPVATGERTIEVVETSGIAEAEAHGKVGTDAPYEAEQKRPGSG